jgi:redox-sensitive bicupin YhaK (pirin superfamily)
MPMRLLLILLLACAAPTAPVLAAEGKATDKTTYVSIDTLTATVTAGNGRRQTMTVQSGVDITDPVLRATATASTPRLRDAYTLILQVYAGGLQSGTPPDPDYLARRLQGATDQVLGKPGARFLIGGIMIN